VLAIKKVERAMGIEPT